MAIELVETIRMLPKMFACGSTSLATKQFYGVKAHTDYTVEIVDSELDFLGILRNTPAAGELCEIAYDGVMRLTAAGATAIFDPLTLDAGTFDVSVDGEVVRALALMSAGTAGDIITGVLFALPHGATLADMTTYFEGH